MDVYWGGPFGIWMLLGLLMQIAVLVLVVLGIIWLFRRLTREGSPPPGVHTRSALEELELRYARGEIDRATYQQVKDDLTKGAG